MALRVGFCGRVWEILRGFERGVGWFAEFPVPTTEHRAPCRKDTTAGAGFHANAAAIKNNRRQAYLSPVGRFARQIGVTPVASDYGALSHRLLYRFRKPIAFTTASAKTVKRLTRRREALRDSCFALSMPLPQILPSNIPM